MEGNKKLCHEKLAEVKPLGESITALQVSDSNDEKRAESETEVIESTGSPEEADDKSFRKRSLRIRSTEHGQPKVLMSGWATKESGQTFLGKHNWRQRWFVLSSHHRRLVLSYSEGVNSEEPKGVVILNQEYSAREIEKEVKGKPHCFALGPALDKSALRTYYISCRTEEERVEWIVMINSAIEGAPEKALRRKTTYRLKGRFKPPIKRVVSDPVIPNADANSFLLHSWRMAQWNVVCDIAKSDTWRRQETKDGVLVCRQSFRNSDAVVVKVEGIIDAPMDVTFEYMQRSIKPGGKFDFAFRKEEVVQKLEESVGVVYISRTVYNVPLPGMKKRDVCLLRTWVPPSITKDKRCGLFVTSVNHPQVPKTKEYERATVSPSGIVLEELEKNELMCTRVTAVFQVDLRDALQNMLRGSYKSGVFRTGLRNFFHHLRMLVQSYYDLVRE